MVWQIVSAFLISEEGMTLLNTVKRRVCVFTKLCFQGIIPHMQITFKKKYISCVFLFVFTSPLSNDLIKYQTCRT